MAARSPEPVDLAVLIIGFTNQVAELSKNIGELTGQVREQIHIGNNNAAMLTSLGERMLKLEKANERREGAAGVVQAILKSPTLGWFVGAAITAWAILTGKVHV